MKYISYIFNILLLGTSFCLSSPPQTNLSVIEKDNETKKHETTTAEPKHGFTSTVGSLLSSTPRTITTKIPEVDSTTQLHHDNVTKNNINYTTSSKLSTTESIKYSTHTTTTAIPAIVSTASSGQRQFDTLSFMGGSVFTFCLMAIGVVLWKAYKLRIDRNYRTI